jgi:hypothetical protein
MGGKLSIASGPRLHPKISSVASGVVISGWLFLAWASVLDVRLLMVDSDPITGGRITFYV